MILTDVIGDALRRLRRRIGYRPFIGIGPFALDASQVPVDEQGLTDLHRLFYQNTGPLVHKWRNYFTVYDRHLARFRGKQARLLEIGVSRGGSLRLWRTYFGPEPLIFGIDVDKRCERFNGRDGQVRIGSQSDVDFLARVVDEMGGVDVVIDDGSHVASDQRKSFEYLFPRLNADGVYICEDLHTSYWRGAYEGGYRLPSAFIEVAKRLIDDMHADFHHHGEGMPGASRCIEGIHFYNSIVVIEKSAQTRPAHVAIGVEEF